MGDFASQTWFDVSLSYDKQEAFKNKSSAEELNFYRAMSERSSGMRDFHCFVSSSAEHGLGHLHLAFITAQDRTTSEMLSPNAAPFLRDCAASPKNLKWL